MLKNMRKNVKSLAPVLWFVILAFIITIFVDWGGAGRVGGGQGSNTIATVGGEKIPLELYVQNLQQRIEALQQQMPELDQNFIQQLNIPQQILEQVIQQTLLLQVAADMGIQASNAEIAERVKALPVFQREGQFVGFDEYQRILNWNRTSTAQFEQGLEKEIIIEKAVKVITSGVTVSADELWENYKKTDESAKLEYIVIPEDKMELSEEPSEEELREYFQAHQDDFQIPEKRTGAYVFLSTEELKLEVRLEDAEIEEYYEDNLAQFEDPETIQVSRIFLPMADKEPGMLAAEINDIRDRIQQGEDFAELARALSQDEKAESGGDWGEFEWRRLSPQEQGIIEGLDQGALSEAVEMADGASLVRVTEKRPAVQKNLESVKEQIQGILTDQKAQELGEERIALLEKEAKRDRSLEPAGQRLGYPLQQTDPLAEGDPILDIDSSGSISRSLFGLEDQGISAPVYTYSGVGLAQLTGIEPSRAATFEEAETDIKEDLDLERKKQLAMQKAAELHSELGSRSFEQVSEAHGFELKNSEEHKREQYLSVVGENPEIDAFAFDSPLDQISEPLRYENGFVLMRVLDRKEVTQEEFEENRETERQGLLDQKRNMVFASFYTKLREEKKVEPNYGLFFQINQQILSYFTR
ncbi:MAG: SurA N-terminal domain-containing protein [Candidatus Aminicenantaceae bacterium]